MRRKITVAALWVSLLVPVLAGCSLQRMDAERIRDIEYTLADKEKLPEELREMIREEEGKPAEFSYGDQGILYAVKAYEEQDTGGYSVQVTDCYESETAVVVETTLLGPEKDETAADASTWPWIALKMEYTDKPVLFQ
ncbi:protease complex subunit PrcB family protein [uncultured Merdimonas sp.]|uniref:protease complex subunit PrcB family protein n=1 Tax=uncultured Merdimonas sp. TaxID=2023269 RepID=UPI0032081EBB